MYKTILEHKYLRFVTYIFFVLVFFFARTFMGIYIFGFRIGEIAIVGSLLIFLISIFVYKKSEYFQNIKDYKIQTALILLFFSFLIMVYTSEGSFTNPYTFKSSSYIWTFGFFFFGLILFNKIEFKITYLYVFLISLLYIYFYSVFGIPENIQNLILNYSDKFEYHKGSDLLIMFIVTFYLFNRIGNNKRLNFEIFIVFTSLYFPLMLYKSRGAFIAFVLFFVIELIVFRKHLTKNLKRNILLFLVSSFLIIQSTFVVTKSGFIKLNEVDEKVIFVATYRAVPQEENRLFYINDNRLFSNDGNLNWRLQIWQDVIKDLNNENKLIIGNSFNEKIPAMDDPFRSGDDGTNENVHNYFINILARGGLIHLFLILYIFYRLIKYSLVNTKFLDILSLLLPIALTSFFDASMENSHFPLIFYFVFGISFYSNKLFNHYQIENSMVKS